MRVLTSVLKSHAQSFIREVMADRLCQEGFISKNNNLIHWYRVMNGEVFQAVYFNALYSQLPVILEIGHSCHPLYISPEIPQSIRSRYSRSLDVVDIGQLLLKPSGNMVYSPAVSVACPNDEYHGLDILNERIDFLNSITSAELCYASHKSRYDNVAKRENLTIGEIFARTLSVDFMDEAVFYDDQDIYPYCGPRIIEKIERYNRAKKIRSLEQREECELEVLHRLRQVFFEGKRADYLKYLRKREEDNIAIIRKKIKGIMDD